MIQKRIVLCTFGSLGDLHPYIAIAIELQRRGHTVILATSEIYRDKITSEGIGFAPLSPDFAEIGSPEEITAKVFDLRKGPEFMIREIMMPFLKASYNELTTIAEGADLIVSHPLTFAAPLVATKQNIRWVSSILAPLSFFSKYDPPVLAPIPWLNPMRGLGPLLYGPLLRMMKRTVRPWTRPVHQLRLEIGLPPSDLDPMLEGQFSPLLNLALFPSVMAAPQPDWPANTVVTGLPYYDRLEKAQGMPSDLSAFLSAGSAPIVFTLGSSAVMTAGDFYAESIEAAKRLQRRAVLLIGRDPRNRPQSPLPESIAAFEYAPYSELFPCAAAIVHQGGIGTTAQGLRAGRPMLFVPYGFDQPDNAERVARLGMAKVIPRKDYKAARAAETLNALLTDPSFQQSAEQVGKRMQHEDGAKAASDAIEKLFRPETV